MCRECDITRLFVRSEVGDVPLVQTLQGLVVEAVLTDIIQQVDEIRVALAVDMCQLNTEIIAFQQCLAVEKEGGRIVLFQQIPFIIFGDRS